MSLDCIVRNGQLVSAETVVRADLGIEAGRIVLVGERLKVEADRIIDATGKYVVPGAVDVHTHFDTHMTAGNTADDYASGTRAAAAGGITTVVNFAFQERGRPLREAAEREARKGEGRAIVDYGVHLIVVDPDAPGSLAEVSRLADEGFTSLKIFTAVEDLALTDRQVLRVLQTAADAGVMVNVHAEDGALIDYLTDRLLSGGQRSVEKLPEARPPEAEALATARVAAYARAIGCPVYVVHLSCRQALDAVRAARAQGSEVFVETRPAYLYLDADRYRQPEREGNKFVCWPPLRRPDDQAALWDGLRSGEIQTYATDHTTWLAAQKMNPELDFSEIPGGVSNVQTSIGMLFSEGVAKGRISLSQFVAVSSTNPAKLFGLWPRKGTLGVGADADLVLIDPGRRFRVAAAEMESRSDFDPYEGFQAVGWPVLTMARGEVIVEEGKVKAQAGRGRFLPRERYRRL